MASDDIGKKILARRSRFVLAALASAGISTGAAGCCNEDGPMGEPCLSIAQPPPDASSVPVTCLSVAPDKPHVEEVEEPKVCLAPPMPSSKPPG